MNCCTTRRCKKSWLVCHYQLMQMILVNLEHFSPCSSSSSGLGEVLQDERDGGRGWCDSLVWGNYWAKRLKGQSFIYLFAASHCRSPWRTFEAGGFDGNAISVVRLASQTCHISPEQRHQRVTLWEEAEKDWWRLYEQSDSDGWRMTDDSARVFHRVKPSSDGNLESIGWISKGLVWLPVI